MLEDTNLALGTRSIDASTIGVSPSQTSRISQAWALNLKLNPKERGRRLRCVSRIVGRVVVEALAVRPGAVMSLSAQSNDCNMLAGTCDASCRVMVDRQRPEQNGI